MAKVILVANWKNHPSSLGEAKSLITSISKKKLLYKKTKLFIAPPSPYLQTVGERLGTWASLASQDFSLGERGTFTGEVTPDILKSFGVRLSIIGHSEQRALGEDAQSVANKVALALKNGITPLVCFGEEVRDADGEHFDFLRRELQVILSKIKKADLLKVVLAYEPVWAIGAKSLGPIEPAELSQTILYIRKILSDLYGRKIADAIPVLYGGSVDDANAGLLVRNSGIAGFLVGRASLIPQKFQSIAESSLEK